MPRYYSATTRRRRSDRYRRRTFRFSLGGLVIALLVLALLVVPFLGTRMLQVDEHVLRTPDLPDNLRNLKIVFVSDIHQGRWFSQQQVNDLFDRINRLNPDIVILGGDYAQDGDSAISFFHTMPDIQAKLGVFAVVGNHDRTEDNLPVLLEAMKSRGVTGLVNSVESVQLGKTTLYIAGVDDSYTGFPRVSKVSSQVREDDYVIFVGHSPDLLPDLLAAKDMNGNTHWYDLALFGHTHGGQIRLFGQPLILPVRNDMGRSHAHGWFEENRASILVSNGVGTSVIPARLFAWPEIHLITLKKGS